MNILLLVHRIPFPPDKGDKIRSFNEIRHLSKRHNIYLGTILDQRDAGTRMGTLGRYCKDIFVSHFSRRMKLVKSLFSSKSFSVSNFYDQSLQDYVNKILGHEKIDAVICFCSSMAEYIFQNPEYKKNGLANARLIMDYVDLDSDKWLQYANYSNFPLNLVYRVENRRLFKYEKRINKTFQHSVFVSQRELSMFKKLYPKARNICAVPNGVDYEYFSPKQTPAVYQHQGISCSSEPVLVFTGVMDYFANEDGVKWFCEKIYPRIRVEFPRVQFYIVGNKPTNVVWNLSEIDGVTVTGYVDDIRNFYWMADVCVVPLRIARGLQNKVIEAMSTGNAVVATSNASDGIICHNNQDIVIADDEECFANEVIRLLKDDNKRNEMGRQAVENIRKHYSWEINLKAFDQLLSPTTDNPG